MILVPPHVFCIDFTGVISLLLPENCCVHVIISSYDKKKKVLTAVTAALNTLNTFNIFIADFQHVIVSWDSITSILLKIKKLIRSHLFQVVSATKHY